MSQGSLELREFCDARGLTLVEDCAHAHGCSFNGWAAGTIGVAGAFSLFPTKVLTSGEGGMVVTNDEAVYREMKKVRNHGKDPDQGGAITTFGYNYRMSELTAILGLQQVLDAPRLIQERQRVARIYDGALHQVPNIRPLELAPGAVSTYYKYIVFVLCHPSLWQVLYQYYLYLSLQ